MRATALLQSRKFKSVTGGIQRAADPFTSAQHAHDSAGQAAELLQKYTISEHTQM